MDKKTRWSEEKRLARKYVYNYRRLVDKYPLNYTFRSKLKEWEDKFDKA